MKQKIFTKKYYEELEARLGENMPKYTDPNFSWEEEAKDNIIELDFEAPDLSGMLDYADSHEAKDDGKAAKILFLAYHNLTPLQAAQRQIWQYLSHVTLYEYMRRRWPTINDANCPESYVKEHWFYGSGLIRNCLEGMYWSVKCSAIDKGNGEYDFTYTDFFFSIQKIRDRGIGAATFIMSNPALVRGMLKFYMDELKKQENNKSKRDDEPKEDTVFDKFFEYRTDKCIQLVNKLGGVVDLSTYTESDIYEFLDSNREYIKSVGDRKKEKKEREAAQNKDQKSAINIGNHKQNRKHKKRNK